MANGGAYDGPTVASASTGNYYRAMSDAEMQAGQAAGEFKPPIGNDLYITQDADRLAGGAYGGAGGGHIVEIDKGQIDTHTTGSQTVANIQETATERVPASAITRTWTYDPAQGDHILQP
jgi:hypothetical protein